MCVCVFVVHVRVWAAVGDGGCGVSVDAVVSHLYVRARCNPLWLQLPQEQEEEEVKQQQQEE